MINSPPSQNRRERSITFAGHPNLRRGYDTLLRSISNRSTSRVHGEVNASTNESVTTASPPRRTFIPLFRNQSSVEKALSFQLNQADFEICDAPNATEMHEFLRDASSEENLRTIDRSDLTNSGEDAADTTDHRSFAFHPTCSSTQRFDTFMHRTWSQIKRKIQPVPCEIKKNTGFLIVNDIKSDPVLVELDQHEPRHAQPSVRIHEDDCDLNRIECELVTPSTPHPTSPQQPILAVSTRPVNHHSNHDLSVQSTRASLECGMPSADLLNVHTTQLSQSISSASSFSTNSSAHEYSAVDRSLLDDSEYVRAQQLDLERLTVLEIRLGEERQALKSDLMEMFELDSLYADALKQNKSLKQELQALEEEEELLHSPWTCTQCTCHNQAYVDCQRDTCDMCESPSPLKHATLTKVSVTPKF